MTVIASTHDSGRQVLSGMCMRALYTQLIIIPLYLVWFIASIKGEYAALSSSDIYNVHKKAMEKPL